MLRKRDERVAVAARANTNEGEDLRHRAPTQDIGKVRGHVD